jgi:hypothetical protein
LKVSWEYKLHLLKKAVDLLNPYANLIVAIATVFMVVLTVILACTAIRQTDVAMQALELNSRPYVATTFYGQSIATPVGQKIMVPLSIRNFGGIPAEVRINGTIIYSITKLSSPALPAVAKDTLVIFPKNPDENLLFIYSAETITEGQFRDIMAGTGWIYARAFTTYGTYQTGVCVEYKLHPSLTGQNAHIDLADIRFCDDGKATSAN